MFVFTVRKDMVFFVTNLTMGTNCDRHFWRNGMGDFNYNIML